MSPKFWSWVRWAFGVCTAIIVSVLISVYIQRDNLISGCERAGDRALYNARNWEEASRIRRESGDTRTADKYKANAQAIRDTIPTWPPSATSNSPAARRSGCAHAYPPPLPYIE